MLTIAAMVTLFLVDDLTDILDDLLVLGNEGGGIDPATVDGRTPHLTQRALGILPHFDQFAGQFLLLAHAVFLSGGHMGAV